MIHIVPDAEAAAEAAARMVGTTLRKRAEQTDGPVCLVLSGGSTPRGMYERLAGRARPSVPWPRIHLLWGDERCVSRRRPAQQLPHGLETGLLGLPVAGIHRMPGELPPEEEGAFRYEQELSALFPEDGFPRLDLVVLGLGGDGHVASLVPGSAALRERKRWVAVDRAVPGDQAAHPDPSRARRPLGAFCSWSTGEAKAEAVRSVLATADGESPLPPPAGPPHLRACCSTWSRHALRVRQVPQRGAAGDMDRRRGRRLSAATRRRLACHRGRPRLPSVGAS